MLHTPPMTVRLTQDCHHGGGASPPPSVGARARAHDGPAALLPTTQATQNPSQRGHDNSSAAAAGALLYNTGKSAEELKDRRDSALGIATDGMTSPIGADHHVVAAVFAGGPRSPTRACPPRSGAEGTTTSALPATTARRGVGKGEGTQPTTTTTTTTTTTAAAPAPPGGSRGVAWRCGLCGYYTLAMDDKGRSLPLSLSAFGAPLPMRCPQCQLEHTSWTVDTPFDVFGRHVNLLATGHAAATPATAHKSLGEAQGHGGSLAVPEAMPGAASPALLSGAGAVGSTGTDPLPATFTGGKGGGRRRQRDRRLCYFCDKCNRRLLRVDAEGELVAMSTDADGAMLPITCPGCRETHTGWSLRPFFAAS